MPASCTPPDLVRVLPRKDCRGGLGVENNLRPSLAILIRVEGQYLDCYIIPKVSALVHLQSTRRRVSNTVEPQQLIGGMREDRRTPQQTPLCPAGMGTHHRESIARGGRNQA